jgi:hypothetical protein
VVFAAVSHTFAGKRLTESDTARRDAHESRMQRTDGFAAKVGQCAAKPIRKRRKSGQKTNKTKKRQKVCGWQNIEPEVKRESRQSEESPNNDLFVAVAQSSTDKQTSFLFHRKRMSQRNFILNCTERAGERTNSFLRNQTVSFARDSLVESRSS